MFYTKNFSILNFFILAIFGITKTWGIMIFLYLDEARFIFTLLVNNLFHPTLLQSCRRIRTCSLIPVMGAQTSSVRVKFTSGFMLAALCQS